MSLLASLTPALAAGLALMATAYYPPGARLPDDAGDRYVLATAPGKLFIAFVHPVALEPGRTRAVTVATINRTPQPIENGRLESYSYMGLIIDCAARKATITGFAHWDENENPIAVFGPQAEPVAILPNTAPEMARALMCEGRGRKTSDYMFQLRQRWAATGSPL